jgi:fibronectin-binding autotransporter adhesin
MRAASVRIAVIGKIVSIVLTFCTTAGAGTTYYWYSGGSGSQGGAGTWNTTSLYWYDGTYHAWPNTTGYDADFGGTAGAVSLNNAAITAGGLTIETTGYSLTTGTLNLGGDGITTSYSAGTDSATISASVALLTSQTWNVGAGSLTVSGTVSGGGTLTKSGAGLLRLTADNTYTGTTTIYGGTVALGNNAASGSIAGDVYTGNVTNGTGTLVFNRTGNYSYDHIISGDGAVTQLSGALTLTQHNTYTGLTSCSGSTLTAGTNDAFGAGGLQVGTNGVVYLTGYSATMGPVTVTGTLSGGTVASNADYTLTAGACAAVLTGNVNLYKTTTGITYVHVPVLCTGTINVDGGQLVYWNDNVLAGGGAVAVNAGTLNLATHSGTVGAVSLGNWSTDGVITRGGTLTSTAGFNVCGGSVTVSAVLAGASGTVGLTKSTPGTVTIATACLYTGTTTIYGGVLQIGTGDAADISSIAASTGINTGDGINGTGTLFFRRQGAHSYDHVISGDGAVTQSCGVLTLSQNNTYTGQTTVSGGTLKVTGSIAASSGVSVGGGTLILDHGVAGSVDLSSNGSLILVGGTAGSVAVRSGAMLAGYGSAGSVDVLWGGALSSATDRSLWGGRLTVTHLNLEGWLSLNFGNVENYSSSTTAAVVVSTTDGFSTAGGSVNLYGDPTAGTTTAYLLRFMSSSGSVSLETLGLTLGTCTFLTTRTSVLLDTWYSSPYNYVVAHVVNDYPYWTGAGDGTWGTSTTPVNWKLASSGSTASYIEGDTVLFDDRASSSSSTVTLAQNVNPTSVTFNNGTATYTVTDGGAGYGISGAATVIKKGAGTVTILNANTYTGPTYIDAGVLNVQNAAAMGTGTVTVGNGGTLQLQGSVNVANSLILDGHLCNGSGTNTYSGSVLVSSAGTVTVSGSDPLTISGSVTSIGNLTKLGAGTLILTGNNSYNAGTTTICAGAVQLGDGTASVTLSSTVYTGDATHGTGTLVMTAGGTASNVITGAGGVTKIGSGVAYLLANNTYSGITNVFGGTLCVARGGSGIQYGPGAILSDVYTGDSTNGTGTIRFNLWAQHDYSGVVSGDGCLAQTYGTLSLWGHSTHTGLTLLTVGGLLEAVDDALGTGPVTVTGGTFTLTGHSDSVGAVTLSSATLAGGTLSSTTGFTMQLSNAINVYTVMAGNVDLNVNISNQTGHLYSVSTYTGNTYINGAASAACLTFEVDNAIAGGGDAYVNFGTLNMSSHSGTVGAVSIGTYNSVAGTGTNGTISGSGTLTSTVGFTSNWGGSITAVLAGNVGFTKTGGSNTALVNANLYTGTTYVNAGTLSERTNNAIYTGPVVVNGGYFRLTGYSDSVGAVTLTNGTIGGGTLTSTSGFTVTSGSVSTILLGSVDLTKDAAASNVTLASTSVYTGTTYVNGGTLTYGATRATGTGNLSVGGGTLDLGSYSGTASIVTLNGGAITGTGTLTGTGGFSVSNGSISATLVGTVNLTMSGAGNTVTLSRTNAYTGTTYVNAGVLACGAAGATGSGSLSVSAGGTLNLGGYGGASSAVTLTGGLIAGGTLTCNTGFSVSSGTISAALAGSGTLTKSGTAAVTLSGANVYTGANYVNGGSLVIQGDAAAAAIFAGTSTDIGAGRLVFNYSGTAAGASIASQVNSILTTSYNGGTNSWASGIIHSTLANTHSTDSYALGWGNDGAASAVTVKVVLYGDATLDGTVNIYDLGQVLANYNKSGTWATGDFNYDGTVNIYDLGTVLANYNRSLSLSEVCVSPADYSGLDGQGVAALQAAGVNVVPEPATLALLTTGAIGLLAYTWRRRSRR